MENVENTTPAVVVEDAVDTPAELPAEELFENLTAPVEDEPAQEEPASDDQPADEGETEHALSPEEAQKQAINNGIQALFEDGWDQEELRAFSKDKTVREQIAAGKDFMRVAAAYERRQRAAKPAAKKAPQTIRSAATTGARDASAISSMTDAQFDEFSRRAKAALLEGKLVSF